MVSTTLTALLYGNTVAAIYIFSFLLFSISILMSLNGSYTWVLFCSHFSLHVSNVNTVIFSHYEYVILFSYFSFSIWISKSRCYVQNSRNLSTDFIWSHLRKSIRSYLSTDWSTGFWILESNQCTSFIYLQNKIRKSIPSKRPGRFINVDQAIITKLQSVLRSSERRVSRLLIGQLSSIQHSHWLILSTQGPTIPCPAQMLWPIHRHILTWPNATTETHDNHSWYNFNTWRIKFLWCTIHILMTARMLWY